MATSEPPPGYFTLLYFASASSFTEKQSEFFAAPMKTTELFAILEKEYPGIKAKVLDSCALTVNREYVDIAEEIPPVADQNSGGNSSAVLIHAGDEVAIIPPVSSG